MMMRILIIRQGMMSYEDIDNKEEEEEEEDYTNDEDDIDNKARYDEL